MAKRKTAAMRPSQCVCVCVGGGVPVPLFPSKKRHCSLVPQKQNFDFLCSLFPKIACVPLFPLFLGLCSPVPLRKNDKKKKKKKKMPLFPKTPWEGLSYVSDNVQCFVHPCRWFAFSSSAAICRTFQDVVLYKEIVGNIGSYCIVSVLLETYHINEWTSDCPLSNKKLLHPPRSLNKIASITYSITLTYVHVRVQLVSPRRCGQCLSSLP